MTNETVPVSVQAEPDKWKEGYERLSAIINSLPESFDVVLDEATNKAINEARALAAHPKPAAPAIPEGTTAEDAVSELKGHQIAAFVNNLRDVAVAYRETQQLRDRISHLVHDFLALRKEK